MEPLSWSGPPEDRLLVLPLDEELDRYRLLAYLQRVDARYRERKLYPYLEELRTRCEQLERLTDRWSDIAGQLPRDVIGLDTRTGALLRSEPRPDGTMRALEAMVRQAMPEIRASLERGADLRSELEGHIRMEAVGIVPLHTQEGYLLLRDGGQAAVYAYALPLYRDLDEEYRHHSIRTRYIAHCTVGIAYHYEQVKRDLVRMLPSSPNPAVFAFECDITLPRVETFMPLAKRLVYETIAACSA